MNLFEEVRQKYEFQVVGYVVMPEHVHVLVNEPKHGTLDRVMQALKLSVTKRRKERPFWQAQYYDFNVSSHAKFVEKLRYMHRNPVKRGLVVEPHRWRWSSFRSYAYGEAGAVRVNGWQILKMKVRATQKS